MWGLFWWHKSEAFWFNKHFLKHFPSGWKWSIVCASRNSLNCKLINFQPMSSQNVFSRVTRERFLKQNAHFRSLWRLFINRLAQAFDVTVDGKAWFPIEPLRISSGLCALIRCSQAKLITFTFRDHSGCWVSLPNGMHVTKVHAKARIPWSHTSHQIRGLLVSSDICMTPWSHKSSLFVQVKPKQWGITRQISSCSSRRKKYTAS